MPESAGRPAASIMAVAAALLIGSLAILCWSAWYLARTYGQAGSMTQVLLYAHLPGVAILDILTILQVGFSLLGILTSVGLLRLRERARIAAIFLSTVPVLVVVFGLFLFVATNQPHGPASIAAGLGIVMYGAFLAILLPVSIWWLVVLTRDEARSHFH